jgi:hypothetical protein
MPTVTCPLCEATMTVAAVDPGKKLRCTSCDERFTPTEVVEDADDSPSGGDGSVTVAQGMKLYRAFRAGHDLLLLHVGDAKQDLSAADLRTWTTDNWKARIRRFVWLKCVLPAAAGLALVGFSVGQFAATFGGDEIDPLYVAGPVVLVLLVLGLVILQRVRTTKAFVTRSAELDAMPTDERLDLAEKKPNLFFPEEKLDTVRVVRDTRDNLKAAKWLLVVTDTKRNEAKFELLSKGDRAAVGPALGDLVEGYVAPPKKPKREERAEPAAVSTDDWFFALVADPSGPIGYRIYPTEKELLLVHTGGQSRTTDAKQAMLVGFGTAAGIVVACAAFWLYWSGVVAQNPVAKGLGGIVHWLACLGGLIAVAFLTAYALNARTVARREEELDGLTPDELRQEMAGEPRNLALPVRDIDDGLLDATGPDAKLTLEDRDGVRRRFYLVDAEDVKAARRVCKALFDGIVRIRGKKKG